MSKKRPPEVPQVPNLHPSSRVEPGTDADVDASIGVQASDVPESNEDGSIVEPGTNAGEESNPNITSESTGAVPDEGKNNESPADKPTSPINEDNNDP
eukprot:5571636-Ditylum_brightwellii.AAC.1